MPPNQNKTLVVSSMPITAHNSFVFYSCISSTHRPGSDTTVGNVACNFKKIPTITQDVSRRCIAMRGESVSTYPRRPKVEAFVNAVDVVKKFHDPTDQASNVRHLRVLHTFSSDVP